MAGKPDLRPVVESISERLILVDGIHNAQIYFLGAAHTKGDLVVYLPTDKVLFAGDLASNGRMPFLQSADVDPVGWETGARGALAGAGREGRPGPRRRRPEDRDLTDSLAYLHAVNQLAKKFVDAGMRDEMLDAQIRAPENEIENVPVTDATRRQREGGRPRRAREGGPQADAGPDARGEVTPSGGITLARSKGGARANLSLAIAPVNVLGARHLEELALSVRDAA